MSEFIKRLRYVTLLIDIFIWGAYSLFLAWRLHQPMSSAEKWFHTTVLILVFLAIVIINTYLLFKLKK